VPAGSPCRTRVRRSRSVVERWGEQCSRTNVPHSPVADFVDEGHPMASPNAYASNGAPLVGHLNRSRLAPRQPISLWLTVAGCGSVLPAGTPFSAYVGPFPGGFRRKASSAHPPFSIVWRVRFTPDTASADLVRHAINRRWQIVRPRSWGARLKPGQRLVEDGKARAGAENGQRGVLRTIALRTPRLRLKLRRRAKDHDARLRRGETRRLGADALIQVWPAGSGKVDSPSCGARRSHRPFIRISFLQSNELGTGSIPSAG
jgi:hypothetical protein